MTTALVALLVHSLLAPVDMGSGDGYKITGRSGVFVFVAVEAAHKSNEDTYRLAVAEACTGKAICQVLF